MQDEGHVVQLRADVNSLEYRSAHARKRACFAIDARGMLTVWGERARYGSARRWLFSARCAGAYRFSDVPFAWVCHDVAACSTAARCTVWPWLGCALLGRASAAIAHRWSRNGFNNR